VIGLPFNDHGCLGAITEHVAGLVAARDPALVALAERYPTTDLLAAYIRTVPHRDDLGDESDGPRVHACKPSQRLRLPVVEDGNCVEKAALYLAVAEIIDPHPVRQLATLELPIGLHTFPIENGAPVILDPQVPRNCLTCGIAACGDGPARIDTRDAIAWAGQLAEMSGTAVRNGWSRVRVARDAVISLVESGRPPTSPEVIEAIGWMFALAERAAHRLGPRAIEIVRTTARAIADLADETLARLARRSEHEHEHDAQVRNLSLEVFGRTFSPAPWASALARFAGRVGLDVGGAVLQAKLAQLGIGRDMVQLVERELNREGMSLGPLTAPPELPTLANLFAPKAPPIAKATSTAATPKAA